MTEDGDRTPRGRIGPAELVGDVLTVAPRLLGARLVHEATDGRVVVRLTEVEAYAGRLDPGSHAYRGRTPRTQVMFGPPGHLYVYFSYGMHWCANVVCGPHGEASAVLLRAGVVVEGVDLARSRRPAACADAELARGPARLTRALGLGRAHNGADLCRPRSRVWLEPAPDAEEPLIEASIGSPSRVVASGPRVGVSGPGGDAAAFPWRFWLPDEPSVSVYRPGKPRRGPAAASGRLSATAAEGHPRPGAAASRPGSTTEGTAAP